MNNPFNAMMIELSRRVQSSGLRMEVPPSGTILAEIAFVGEAPGVNELRMKMPFVGGAGAVLFDALKSTAQITRQHVYVTNVAKRLPEQSAKAPNDVRISKNELSSWKSLIQWELSQLPNLKIVVILGGVALEALTDQEGIMNWRGSVLPITIGDRQVTALCTINPAMAVREPKLEPVFRMDISKIHRIMRDQYQAVPRTTHYNLSADDAINALKSATDLTIPVAYDIEVIGGETACFGFASSISEATCINFRDLSSNRYTVEEEIAIRRAIQNMLMSSTPLVAQNGFFDSYWMWMKDRIKSNPLSFDTMLAHHLLYPTMPHGLGFLTTQYTTHPFYKDEKDNWREGGDINRFWEYNGKDAMITLECRNALHREMEKANLLDFFSGHIMRLQPHLIRMTVGGVKIDVELKDQIAQELRDKVAIMAKEFHQRVAAATGDENYFPNYRSPKQLQELFFNRLRLVGRGVSTDDENRKRMHDHPRTSPEAKAMLTHLDKLKEEDKFLSTYAEAAISQDGRIRCEWKQTGTQNAPGRLSSSKLLTGEGMNLQNQPKRAYSMFIADPGYCFVYFDLEQAEARYVGWIADIAKWKSDFERARLNPGAYDCHRALASDMWGIPYESVPVEDFDEANKPTRRFIAKRCRHGLNYRMAPDRLATTTGLPIHEAEAAYNVYHRTSPEVRKWWEHTEKEIKTNNVIYNSYGRRLVILGRQTPEALESIVAFRPQSSIGDKVCRVIYLSESDDLWPSTARVALNIHDALIALCRIENAKRVASIMRKYAEEPIMVKNVHGVTEPMIIPASFKVSVPNERGVHSWATLKKLEDF